MGQDDKAAVYHHDKRLMQSGGAQMTQTESTAVAI
jgi:hypothetical protein